MSISSLLKSDEKVYVFCRNNQIAKLFLKRAEEEGFLFGDGLRPTEKHVSDYFVVYRDWTISYTGWIGRLNCREGDGVLVDYGRFMCGGDYVIQG